MTKKAFDTLHLNNHPWDKFKRGGGSENVGRKKEELCPRLFLRERRE